MEKVCIGEINMSDNENGKKDNIDKRNYQEMSEMLALSQHVMYKKYLTELSEYGWA